MNTPQNSSPESFLLTVPKERKSRNRSGYFRDVMNYHAGDLVRLLAVPLKSHERRNPFSFHRKTAAVKPTRRTAKGELAPLSILHLPVEVQRMIFERLYGVKDRMCLGLTCTYFWSMALPYMHDRWASKMGLWAGKNLLLVGAHTKAGDLPPGLFSEEEIDAMRLRLKLEPIGEGKFSVTPPVTLFTLCVGKDSEHQPIHRCDPLHTWHKCFKRGVDRNLTEDLIPWGALSRREDLDDLEGKDFYPADEPWILRNLTTKQFVRAEAIALRPEFVHGPKIKGLGFGHVVLARIGWSSKQVPEVSSPVDVTRGVWAGHRFDITPVARHKKDTEGEKWVDVSQEVVDEMNIIYTGLYGPAWKEPLMDKPFSANMLRYS